MSEGSKWRPAGHNTVAPGIKVGSKVSTISRYTGVSQGIYNHYTARARRKKANQPED